VLDARPASLELSRARIAADIAALSGPDHTLSAVGITRHAYTDAYRNTLAYFERAFADLGYAVHYDPVGTLVASNRAPGEPCHGLGSHCDANRNGGPYDGTLGVVAALEVCRLARERGLDLPLRVLSFLEEEGSGFGETLLGSRIMLGQVARDELEALTDDRGTGFFAAARDAGFEPDRFAESGRELDGMLSWIELHIEQGRTLEDAGDTLGIVTGIAGYVHGDLTIEGRADHAGGTAMELHCDPLVTAGEVIVELEALTRRVSPDAVGTVGEIAASPGLINVIPGSVTFSLDLRSVSGAHLEVLDGIVAYARERAATRGQPVRYAERHRVAPTPMDPTVVAALREAADDHDVRWREMPSGGAHDTMLVAARVPSAMVFVPCEDGVSHAPEELADPGDAALGAHVMLDAIERLEEARR
jgi:hydantoinase/carbamoylase family amidase